MSTQSQITRIQNEVSDQTTLISQIQSALASKVTGDGYPIEVSTDAGMTSVNVNSNIGKCYKFIGTTGTYKTGNLYIVKKSMPTKGQLITMSLGNATPAAGTQDTYRVLSVDGNVALVVAMFDQSTSRYFGSNNTYSGSTLDTYLNTTWYNSLSSTAKSAIQSTTITQYQYTSNSSVYDATTHASYADYSNKESKAVVGNRYVYALDVEDIEAYFNGVFSTSDIWTLFWSTTSKPSIVTFPWLRSAYAGSSDFAWLVGGYGGYLNYFSVSDSDAVRPAFRIDLSQISWS